ncbi:MAG: hypothetical protein AB8B52_14450 [Winogradskyella sp.]|uniref:hypothetical protein n=1 Tax=Winogradskyella sp. TaxID=1883156 RepID=UPI00385F492E
MFKKIIFAVSFIVLSLLGNAQKNINYYKYVIIPKSFEFSKGEDQYQLNSLLKFLFNKHGYEAYFLDELPEDLKKDRCLGLMAEVSNDESGMFKTKLGIALKDCFENVLMTSKIGESRLKQYDKAYNQALRDAFETFQNLNYIYTAQESLAQTPKEEKQPVKEMVKVEEKVAVPSLETETNQSASEIKSEISEIFYAQTIPSGFQLVNSEPKVVMILLSTSAKEVFIVKDKNAIVYKNQGKWFYSENDGVSTLEKEVNIKF